MKRLVAALVFLSATSAYAQTGGDPTGHWEGTVKAEGLEVTIQADFAKNPGGDVIGTLTLPAENIKGLPMKVTVSGRSISFSARADQPMTGTLSEDGKSMQATFKIQGYTIPFSMVRTGDPQIEPAARIDAIGKDLEGSWTATLAANGAERTLVLTFANAADGTGSAVMVSPSEGGLQLPASAVSQRGSTVTVGFKIVSGVYAATLNADRNELVGTYTKGSATIPVTFRRNTAR